MTVTTTKYMDTNTLRRELDKMAKSFDTKAFEANDEDAEVLWHWRAMICREASRQLSIPIKTPTVHIEEIVNTPTLPHLPTSSTRT